ncbi:MAG: hypothetical protein V4819_10195 [Verrucomicrobiota bacterium]
MRPSASDLWFLILPPLSQFLLVIYRQSRSSWPVLLAAAIECLYDLRVGTTPVEEGTPYEKPHKPLLAAFDLIDEGLATPNHIPWCQALRDRFTACVSAFTISAFSFSHPHPRRSNGEKELLKLSGQSLLLPQDEAFHPDSKGLSWRLERLIA